MESLTKKDVEILDLILKTAVTKGKVFPDDLPPLRDYKILVNASEFKRTDYAYYFDILNKYEIVKIYTDLNSFRIEPIPIKADNFYNQGGFKAIFDERQRVINRNKELDELSFKKLKWDSKLSKWQVKTFWWIFAFACFGGLYSTYDILTDKLRNKKTDQQIITKSQMDSELTKLRALISDQKKVDSIDFTKINKDTLNKK